MQSILTKFIAPSNTRGSRYKATCEAGTLTMHADPALDNTANHVRVAQALIAQLGWFHDEKRGDTYGEWHFGETSKGFVFVCLSPWSRVERGVK